MGDTVTCLRCNGWGVLPARMPYSSDTDPHQFCPVCDGEGLVNPIPDKVIGGVVDEANFMPPSEEQKSVEPFDVQKQAKVLYDDIKQRILPTTEKIKTLEKKVGKVAVTFSNSWFSLHFHLDGLDRTYGGEELSPILDRAIHYVSSSEGGSVSEKA